MITEEEFLKDTNEEEVFCLIESFLQRWIKEVKNESPNYPNKKDDVMQELYNNLPTDKQKITLIRDILKSYK